jgi:lysophospholipid acyltransferase (LPLAT)-like uncharacterized protein
VAQKLEPSTPAADQPQPEPATAEASPQRPGPLFAGPSPLPKSSRRKRTRTRRLAYAIAAPLILGITRLLWATCRVEAVLGEEHAALLASDKPVVLCYWHDEIFTTGFYIERVAKRKLRLSYMVSPSVDGDLVEKLLTRSDAHVIRGSATRSGIKPLRHMYRAMMEQGISPVLLPDGPIGPQYECKAGAAMLAQLAGAAILPIAGVCSRVRKLKTWDRLRLPLPFARLVIAFGPPQVVSSDSKTGADVNAASAELGATLNDLCRQAAARLTG